MKVSHSLCDFLDEEMEISRPSYPTADEAHILCDMGEEAWGKSGRKIHLYPQKKHKGNGSKMMVGARSSILSQKQVEEVFQELSQIHPEITFCTTWFETLGDIDLTSSLANRPLDDFFTREIDEALLQKKIQIAIHSAKDLPRPIPRGLKVVALTKGLDSSDSLVLRDNMTLCDLPKDSKIATSSLRRQSVIQKFVADCQIVDIRGTIEKRLQKLFDGDIDGLVVANCALMRLGFHQLNTIAIPGEAARYQGRLAVVARADDIEMEKLFCPINTKRMVHFGLEEGGFESNVFHLPLIETTPLIDNFLECQKSLNASHLLFTSKTSARYFVEAFQGKAPFKKNCLAIGKATASCLRSLGFCQIETASQEDQEGLFPLLQALPSDVKIFWPHSNLSRDAISEFCKSHHIFLNECILYTTVPKKPPFAPDFNSFDELFFSSPSTVEAFFSFFGKPPADILISCKGAQTNFTLQKKLAE